MVLQDNFEHSTLALTRFIISLETRPQTSRLKANFVLIVAFASILSETSVLVSVSRCFVSENMELCIKGVLNCQYIYT